MKLTKSDQYYVMTCTSFVVSIMLYAVTKAYDLHDLNVAVIIVGFPLTGWYLRAFQDAGG